jgi:hypothetical protein
MRIRVHLLATGCRTSLYRVFTAVQAAAVAASAALLEAYVAMRSASPEHGLTRHCNRQAGADATRVA